jgi:hypothetical protein
MGQKRSADQARRKFDNQIGHMRRSCFAFDQLEFEEYERIAAAIKILVHDKASARGRPSQSALTQIGVDISRLEFVQSGAFELSGPVAEGSWRNPLPLVTMQKVDGAWSYVPLYGRFSRAELPNLVSFDTWWNQPIFETADGRALARSELILTVRDQDGGSHIDSEIDGEKYLELLAGGRGFHMLPGDTSDRLRSPIALGGRLNAVALDGWVPLPNADAATIRQIAWELETTFIREDIIENWKPRVGISIMPPDHRFAKFGTIPQPLSSPIIARERIAHVGTLQLQAEAATAFDWPLSVVWNFDASAEKFSFVVERKGSVEDPNGPWTPIAAAGKPD